MVTPMTLTLGMKWNILSVEKVPNIVLKTYTNCQKEPFHPRYVDYRSYIQTVERTILSYSIFGMEYSY